MIYKLLFILSLFCIPTKLVATLLPEQTIATDLSSNSSNPIVSPVKVAGKNVILTGKTAIIGQQAPNAKVVDGQFNPIHLQSLYGNILLINVVSSIDTGTCSLQTKRFNDAVEQLGSHIKVITISTDLPFAQQRFCHDENIKNLSLYSDALWKEFGYNYGLLIKGMGLLTRAVLIIDQQGILRYQQLVENLSQQPDYTAAFAALESISTQQSSNQG